MLELSTPVKYIKRVGERIATALAARGVETVEDLLYHLPFRYEDRLNPQPIETLVPGTMASVMGEVRGAALLRTRSGPMMEMTLGQGLATIKCIWFHAAYLKDRFRAGQQVAVYGKLEASRSALASGTPGKFKMIQPQFEVVAEPGKAPDPEFAMLEMGRIVPVYQSLGGTTPWGAKLTSRWMRRVVWSVFEELEKTVSQQVTEPAGQRGASHLDSEMWEKRNETLPAALLARLDLPSRMAALKAAHFPEPGTSMTELMAATTSAHRRLIFEELFYLELGLSLKRRRMRERRGTAFATGPEVREALKQVLPFHPTAAQKRVLGEIVADMRRPQPMRRLLQGDVGSGKTIVAMQAALVAIENGTQVAMMAPTEILATQHYLSARKLLRDKISPHTGKPYRVALLTGSLDPATKRQTQGRIMRGEADLVIGTHALQEEKADFANLGLVIVDEQHRFGVQQRFRLMKKPAADGTVSDPDVLAMTATPIPRTLALTIYGDLDVSVIDELPPGRTPIVTRRTTEERADEVWEFVRKQVAQGRQAYLVYPIIEGANDDQPELDFAQDVETEQSTGNREQDRKLGGGSGELDDNAIAKPPRNKSVTEARAVGPSYASLGRSPRKNAKTNRRAESPAYKAERAKLRSATEMFEDLRAGALKGLRLGLLHGRLSPDEKEITMARFQRGEIDVLISTTVIEVGVDVSNATVMVIDHAERFGLSQMHQLRGRVGRGAAKSYCILMTGERVTEQAEARLNAMVATQNGFELAELDLAQRGPGEFFGTRQTGLPEFRMANLLRDRPVLELAKMEAERFAAKPDPGLTPAEIAAVWDRLKQQWQRRYGLMEA
ncbi:MAG TPA: ATP-dependent DNA helicase RecG [Acidobacteriaceae bacterium]|nr:ATP-dependent DNA helicase RecG [Acidobacteriaceae bacterium]